MSIFLNEIGVRACQQCYRATRDYATGVVIFLGFRMSAFEDNFAAESSTHGQDEVRFASFLFGFLQLSLEGRRCSCLLDVGAFL